MHKANVNRWNGFAGGNCARRVETHEGREEGCKKSHRPCVCAKD